jgi:hypothetical protein
MNENEQLELEIESKLAYILGTIYNHIPWSKLKITNAHTFFMNRIRASSNTRTFKEYIDVLCKKLNIEMVILNTECIDFLNNNNAITMKLIRTESLYICNFAIETATKLKNGGK